MTRKGSNAWKTPPKHVRTAVSEAINNALNNNRAAVFPQGLVKGWSASGSERYWKWQLEENGLDYVAPLDVERA